MFYSIFVSFSAVPIGDGSAVDSTPPYVFVSDSFSDSSYSGQSALDYLSSLGFSIVDSAQVNFPPNYPVLENYLALDYSNFNPSLDVYYLSGDVVFVKDNSPIPLTPTGFNHFYDGSLSIISLSPSEVIFVKSPSVDYQSIVSSVLATSFVEVSLNGSNGAKFKDGDIVEVQGFPSQYEVLASQYIVNNENTGTIMYKVKDVNTGMIHYVPQVFLRGVSNDTNS